MSQAVLECCTCTQMLAVNAAQFGKLQDSIARHVCSRAKRGSGTFRLHMQHEDVSYAVVARGVK